MVPVAIAKLSTPHWYCDVRVDSASAPVTVENEHTNAPGVLIFVLVHEHFIFSTNSIGLASRRRVPN
jgi:hypothetical protein